MAHACSESPAFETFAYGVLISEDIYLSEVFENENGRLSEKIQKVYKGSRKEGNVFDAEPDKRFCAIGELKVGFYLRLDGWIQRHFDNSEESLRVTDQLIEDVVKNTVPLQLETNSATAPHVFKLTGPDRFFDLLGENCERGKIRKGRLVWGELNTERHCEQLSEFEYRTPGKYNVFAEFADPNSNGKTYFFAPGIEVKAPDVEPSVQILGLLRDNPGGLVRSARLFPSYAIGFDYQVRTGQKVDTVASVDFSDGTSIVAPIYRNPLASGRFFGCVLVPRRMVDKKFVSWRLRVLLKVGDKIVSSDQIAPINPRVGLARRCTKFAFQLHTDEEGKREKTVVLEKFVYPTISVLEVNWGDGSLETFECDVDCRNRGWVPVLAHKYAKTGTYQIRINPHLRSGLSYVIDVAVR